MYALLFLAGLLSAAFLALAVRENRTRLWVGYLASTLVGMFTHYFFVFLVAGEVAFYVFGHLIPSARARKAEGTAKASVRRPWRLAADVPSLGPWLACGLVIAVLMTAWLARSVFLQRPDAQNALIGSAAGSGLGYGQDPPRLALRFNDMAVVVVQMTAGFHGKDAMESLVAAWPLILYIPLLLLGLMKPVASHTRLLLAGAAGIAVMMLLGQWQGQILASRYFAAVAAPAFLVAARVLAKLDRRAGIPVMTGLVLVALVAWVDQSYNPGNAMVHGDRAALGTIAREWRPGDAVVYVPFFVDPLANYYLPKSIAAYGFPQYGQYGELRNAQGQIDQDLDRIVGASGRVWLFLAYQDVPQLRSDGYAVRYWLKHQGYSVRLRRRTGQVEVLRFDGGSRRREFFMSPTGAETSATP